MSDYGEDISDADSVGSLLEEQRNEEEQLKKSIEMETESIKEEQNRSKAKDRQELYERLQNALIQDASNDKMYRLVLKLS